MMRITTELKGLLSGKVPPRTMARMIKEALSDEAVAWRENTLQDHFKEGAGNKYKYQGRTRPYLRRKLRVLGHRKPMVYTGAAMRKILADKRRPTATQKGVLLKLKSPGFFHYAYPGWPKTHAMRDEIKQTTASERQALARGVTARLSRKVKELKKDRAYYVALKITN